METEEILQQLSKIDKKLDKCLKMVTTIAKTLHIVPVSEKEEREIQLLQRKNAATIQKIQDEIAELDAPTSPKADNLSFDSLFSASNVEIYNDVLGTDILEEN